MSPPVRGPIGPEHRPASTWHPALEIHRSVRRRRSASAAFRDDRIVVRLPADLPSAEEQRLLEEVVRKVTHRHTAQQRGGDEALTRRAHRLADRYLDGVRAERVTWSNRMATRYGSCTPADGSIRISSRLAGHPPYVVDYILIHELAHLHVGDHSPAFKDLVARYPQAERARGFLEGFAAGRYEDARDAAAGDAAAGGDAVGGDAGGGDAGGGDAGGEGEGAVGEVV